MRKKDIDDFNGYFPDLFSKVSGTDEKLEVVYSPSWKDVDSVDGIIEILSSTRERDVKMQTTTSGIHRDRFNVVGKNGLFSQYAVRNASGETRSVLDIFADKGLVPPGGTGDCAAPRLLQYAFTHSLEPVSMGEFWYCGEDIAAGPEDPVQEGHSRGRRKGEFCPACSSKCGPLLRWMLKGLDTDNPYAFDDSTVPEILWEDESLLVVSNPAGMLCVPGNDGQ